MSYRGRSKWSSNNNRRFKNEHDDRGRVVHFSSNSSKSNNQGSSFSFNRNRRGGLIVKRGNTRPKPLMRRLGEDDIDMDGQRDTSTTKNNRRFQGLPYNRRGTSRSWRGTTNKRFSNDQLQRVSLAAAEGLNYSGRKTELPASDWYKVTIPYGKDTEKEVLLRLIVESMNNVPFTPIQYHYEQLSAVFYVQDRDTATNLKNLSRQITKPSGNKVIILVRACSPPISEVNVENIEKLKICMSNRYDPTTKVLNLEKFQQDEELTKQNLYFPLYKINIILEVLKIIKENIPEMKGLKIGGNKFYNLNPLKKLAESAPCLEHLDVGRNELKTEFELDIIKNLKLTGLVLDGNPLCDRFKDNTSYLRAVRKRFPKLITLDGNSLPPPVTFEIETQTSLPETQGSYFETPQAKDLVCRFLSEYFQVYDSDDRQPLLAAYHENAIFSLLCGYNKLVVGKQPDFNSYLSESRNILKISDNFKRQKLLKSGKVNVVALLNQLPKTEHDKNSTVDITHISSQIMSFTVTGVFKEKRTPYRVVRHFSRSFVTAPMGSGIVIINEELSITNATPDQIKKAFKSEVVAAQPGTSQQSGIQLVRTAGEPSQSQAVVVQAGPSAQVAVNDEFIIKNQMVVKFCEGSKMNEEWSKICLEQNNWNFEKAVASFEDCMRKGTIPAEAFTKT